MGICVCRIIILLQGICGVHKNFHLLTSPFPLVPLLLASHYSFQRALDASNVAGADVCISLRCSTALVAQQLLDIAQFGAGFQQVGSEGMPQDMDTDLLSE